jgi:NCAIR mutase (PurE)-related protein
VDPQQLEALLNAVRNGDRTVAEGLEALAGWPEVDLGHTRLDTDREARCGHAEVIYGAGKTPAQLVDIATAILGRGPRLLATRVFGDGAGALLEAIPDAIHHADAGCVTVDRDGADPVGSVLVLSAGTSDRPVAEEAAVTARHLGARVEHLADVGVAGLHRLLKHTEAMRAANALVVVAGMEGALPSVVGGLVDVPVVAVPTSVGYGASFGGVAALLAMLNSCASGITVVNVDNGFGAGFAAARINRLAVRMPRHE